MMEKIQAWIEKHLVPVINKITSNFWFGIVADAVTEFSEQACARGAYGHLKADGFMPLFMKTN